ncbi:MAG: hypothetical protein JO291_01785 [Acidimicrobiia bacterium]|nr:hypothetical protein [Acidimicrobiia bacterium]
MDRGVESRREHRLILAGYLFAVGSTVHMVDHLRRGQGSVTAELYWVGTVALAVQVAVITLVLTRHRVAPLAAAATGFPLALGFFAAHWLPHWSGLSDPVWKIGSWFSYVASSLEIIGALALGLTGLSIVRARGLAAFGHPAGGTTPSSAPNHSAAVSAP